MTFHQRVAAFKATVIEEMLRDCEGSRSVAAERLGLQRTYLVRLIRDLGVAAPSTIVGGQGQALARRLRAHSATSAASAS